MHINETLQEQLNEDFYALVEKAKKATKCFLERRDMKVLAQDWTCDSGTIDFIAMENDSTLCLIKLGVSQGFDEKTYEDSLTKEKRQRLEATALNYLSTSELSDCAVRFDAIHLFVINDKALLRYHTNILGRAL